ncbi:MAG TPA: TonB family protein, partial [Haliangiales bacterium]|nr:TonB family protein [Haliangiales bacterium]
LTWVSDLVRPKPHRPLEVTWIQKPPLRSTAQPLPPLPPARPPVAKKVQPKVPPPPEVKPEPPPPIVQAPPPKPQKKKEEPPKPPQVKEPPKPALIPQPPKPVQKPPEEQKPKPPEQPKVALPKERHKTVEVDDDKNVVKEEPADAEYLSDKNRVVAEQTRDTRTNLEKQENGKASASEKSDDNASKEVGGEDEEVRQLEKAEATTLEKKNVDPTAHSGEKDKAVGLIIGTKGREGSRGDSGAGGEGGKPGTLSMRNIEGRGAPGMDHSLNVAPSPGANDDAPEVAMSKTPGTTAKQGDGGKAGAPGAPGKRGPKLALDFEQYERAIGSDKYRDEIEVAKRSKSHKKGRWEKKLDAIHSSLENFVPEVKPGNQNALGTRAAPFAVYIARVHRKIHELWGFGFLSDLDLKSPTDPMNNRDLKVTLEIVLNSDGTVDKATIVKGSGVLTFDVAAIDSVMSAGPFEKAPQEIVSGNGKVYLHWTFHRDERQCSPYFADPFILDNAGPENEKRGLPEPSEEIARRKGLEKISRDGSPTKSTVVVPHVTREQIGSEGDTASAARANANLPAPDDPGAQDAALRWANAFESGDVGAMVAASGVPFHVGGQKFGDLGDLGTVWRGVLAEVSSHEIKEWKVMSPAGYRAVFGRLPKGADDTKLYLAARVGKEWLTLELGSSDGKYKVVGLYR